MRRKYEVWALYHKPVRVSRHWTLRGALRACLNRQFNSYWGQEWVDFEVRERPPSGQI